MKAQRIQHHIEIEAAPSEVFAVWARLDEWHRWDPDTVAAMLPSPLAPGAEGFLTLRKGRKVRMVVGDVVDGSWLYLRCPVLGSSLHFDHRVRATERGCVATHEAWLTGWLAPLLRASVGRDIDRGLPVTLVSLKRYVEALR